MIVILGLVFDGWVFRSMVSVAFSGSWADVAAVCCQVFFRDTSRCGHCVSRYCF